MKKHVGVLVLAGLVVGSLAVYTFAYQVDEKTDIVLIETFGEITRETIGRDDPGLKFKWPYPVEKVVRYDSRTSVFEDTGDQATTRDDQSLLVTVYCAWRIAKPATFHSAIDADNPDEKMAKVEKRLRAIVRSKKLDIVSKHDMTEFINTDPTLMQLEKIEGEILARVRDETEDSYGVEIVGIGIRNLGLPKSVTVKVIDNMKEERQEEVKSLESDGHSAATAIEERARSDRDQILAFAERKGKEIRTEGDQAAAKYYRRFEASPEFSIFLRKLESLKVELAEKTVFLLDGSALPQVRWFKDGPSVEPDKTKAPPAPDVP